MWTDVVVVVVTVVVVVAGPVGSGIMGGGWREDSPERIVATMRVEGAKEKGEWRGGIDWRGIWERWGRVEKRTAGSRVYLLGATA